MSDFTIAATDVPKYDPWSPLQAMGTLAQQNNQITQGQIQNQSSLLNLQLQRARLAPVISALQGYGQQLQGASGGLAPVAANAPPVAPIGSGGASGVTATPLAAPGSPGPAAAPGGGAPPGQAPGGPPPGAPASGDPSSSGLPPGPGDMAQQLIGVPLPMMAYAAAAGSADPSGDIAKLVDTRRQWLYSGAAEANSPGAWNSFVMSAYNNGWASASQANQLLNHFELQPRVLQAMASPDENLKYTEGLSGQGLTVDANGNPVPSGPAIAAKGDIAAAEQTGRNASDLIYQPQILSAENPALIERAGGTAGAEAGAKAPYEPPISIQVPDGKGGYTTEQVPVGAWAASQGGGAQPPPGQGGAANPSNPGNLKNPGGQGFQSFDNPQAGVLAMSDQLQRYAQRGINTIAGVVSTYAPSSENNTPAYIAAVSKAAGFGPNQKIDLTDPNFRYRVMQAMLEQESGAKGVAALNALGGAGVAGVAAGSSGPAPVATGTNPNVIPAGIAPGPGQVNAPPVAAAPAPAAPAAAGGAQPVIAVSGATPIQPAPAAAPAPAVPALPTGGNGVPPAPAPVVPGAIPGGFTPGPVEQAQIASNVTQMADYRADLLQNAHAAVQQNAVLDQMAVEAPNFTQGEFADVKGDLAAALDGIAKTLGVPESQQFTEGLGSWQAFNKNAGNLARSAAHELGSRTGVQELEMIQRTLPSDQTSAEGFSMVKNQLQGLNDYMIAKSAASANYQGVPNTFDAAWNANVSPTAFILNRMSNADASAMLQRIAAQPGGVAMVQQLKQEYLYAQQNGLFKMVTP